MNDQRTNSQYVAMKTAKDVFINIINDRYLEIKSDEGTRQELIDSERDSETGVKSFLHNEKNYTFGELRNRQSGAQGRNMAQQFLSMLVDCESTENILDLAIKYEAKAGPTFKKVLRCAVLQCLNIEYVSEGLAPINEKIIKAAGTPQDNNYKFFMLALPGLENRAIDSLYQRAKSEINGNRTKLQHSVHGLLYKKLGNPISKPRDYDQVENAIKATKERDELARAEGVANAFF